MAAQACVRCLEARTGKHVSATCQYHHPWHGARVGRRVPVATARPPEAEILRSSAWPFQLMVPTHELRTPFWKHELADMPLALRSASSEWATILQVALWPNG